MSKKVEESELVPAEVIQVVLNELTSYGWGNFLTRGNEIRIDYCAVSLPYVVGYLETMFKVHFRRRQIGYRDTVILTVDQKIMDEKWL